MRATVSGRPRPPFPSGRARAGGKGTGSGLRSPQGLREPQKPPREPQNPTGNPQNPTGNPRNLPGSPRNLPGNRSGPPRDPLRNLRNPPDPLRSLRNPQKPLRDPQKPPRDPKNIPGSPKNLLGAARRLPGIPSGTSGTLPTLSGASGTPKNLSGTLRGASGPPPGAARAPVPPRCRRHVGLRAEPRPRRAAPLLEPREGSGGRRREEGAGGGASGDPAEDANHPGQAPGRAAAAASGRPQGGATVAAGEGPPQAPPTEREGPRPTQPVYQLHSRGLAPPAALDPAQAQARLAAPEKMKTSIKLVDEQMNWCDSALEFLLEQTDVLVVGALGLQGTGKSTVMSLLAGNQPEEDPRSFVFRPQPPELRERGGAQTGGIDLFVTQERVLFLDTQPILSPAHLDHLINNDRKLPPEFALPHAYVETQIAAFLFTVCHVVLLVQDWFTDLGLYRFLQTAEMVKPPTPSPSHDSSGAGAEEPSEYYPHLVFVQTRAPPECFSPRRLGQMQRVLGRLMAHSRLKYRGSLSMRELLPSPPGAPPAPPEPEVNLFLLPPLEEEPEDALPRGGGGALFPALPPFRGRGGLGGLLARLRGRVLAAARSQLSHSLLTERNWFHYAARIWDGVKKSSALAEYGRLLG
ncbi:protein SMG9 isoform X4 [Motacilla alba alba]|uniref:protein SMG9 isoform X4 n=1 Tax=Motacilla alba alba TaxID=1094192 RepID=UPI0018D5198B|nr:protein SMG9 isoform X4 [Motacilla alba alba]